MIGREDEIREYRLRIKSIYAFVTFALMLLGFRLVYLQIIKGEELRRYSEANRLKKEKLFPTRGLIYDRKGRVIVDNRGSFDIVLFSQYYPFKKEVNEKLAKVLKMNPEELDKKLAKAAKAPSFYPTLLKANASKDVLAAIEMDAEGIPGIDIEATVQRRYPFGDIAAQLLGYIGEVETRDIKNDPQGKLLPGDYIGKMGIERQYDAYLRGVNGVGYVEVDALGRRRKTEALGDRILGYVTQTDPQPGSNLYLTIDLDLQLVADHAFKSRGYHGSLIALDPRSGELLALVNNPSYEPGLISGREIDPKVWAELSQNKNRPLRNRAIQDHYPPGSTFKLFLSVAGLAEGVVNRDTTVNCSGHMQFGSRRFHCWKKHGTVDFLRSIKESCDVFYYQLGLQLGVDRIAKYARFFGFGSPTGVKITGEQKGLIPDTAWKEKTYKAPWHPGETLSVAIGQGYVDVTPIQLVSAYSAIANGGFVYRPYLVNRIEKPTGELIKEYQPELIRKIEVSSEVFDAVKEGLFQVVNQPGGTAFYHRSSKTVMSGKTGTAQVRAFHDIMKKKCENMNIEDRHHGVFVGYAPKENPQIAVMAIAEHSCHGSSAAPLVREVLEAYLAPEAPKPLQVAEVPKKKIVKVVKPKKHEGEEVGEDSQVLPPERKVSPTQGSQEASEPEMEMVEEE